ncbi:hypothetical protein HAX54_023614 [Datura stramonium]|uniref:Uncharacterized protein n=1 Tax=Datura stramonium TaxID=4076 RepID=A0ABS8S5V9_DATST|nr:hypothetical protein [Datura stramonium]
MPKLRTRHQGDGPSLGPPHAASPVASYIFSRLMPVLTVRQVVDVWDVITPETSTMALVVLKKRVTTAAPEVDGVEVGSGGARSTSSVPVTALVVSVVASATLALWSLGPNT